MLTTEKIHQLIASNTPNGTKISVRNSQWAMRGEMIKIMFTVPNQIPMSANDPVCVSLAYDGEQLAVQIYGGTGGQCLTVDPENKMYAFSRVKIPFRTVKNKDDEKKYDQAVENAIVKFASRWTAAMIENVDRLSYRVKTDADKTDPKKIDYRKFLGL